MNLFKRRSVAEASSKSVFQAQNIHIHGGIFNSAGNQRNYYGGGRMVKQHPTEEEVTSALKEIPNYRGIHWANLRKATEGTGPRFAEWKEYCEWLVPGGILKGMWGTGMPGAGKTIFAAIAINAVEAHAELNDSPICVGYIYFRYSDHTQATTRDFLEVLVKQTTERHPMCVPICREVYARHIRENTRPSERELLYLLQSFAEMMLATFYFLEALDEAPPDAQLDLLERLCSLNVQLFITSRSMPHLQARFPVFHQYSIRAQARDLDLHINKEISRSIVLQHILATEGPGLEQRVREKVKETCGGMFLHASLQLDALRDCANAYSVDKVLETFPPRIEDIYQQTWQRICDQTPENALIGKNTLLWVLCAERSLEIEELRHLVAACPETYKVDPRRIVDEQTLMSLSRGLVAVSVEGGIKIVRFVHYTAKDVVRKLVSKTNPHPHSIPTQACLELLVKHGFQQSRSDAALDQAMAHDPPLRYAYNAWPFHARQSLEDDAAVARLAKVIQDCSSFPVYRQHPHSPRAGWDRFQPLHMVSYFDLPLSLIRSGSLCKPNLPTSNGGFTPLMLAVIRRSIRRVEEVLAQPHTLVNSTNIRGETALLLASRLNYEEIIRLLLHHPQINPNQADLDGDAPLILASRYGNCNAVRLLLAHPKIKVNEVDYDRWTALMNAAWHRYPEIVQVLLIHPKIKINEVDNRGKSALTLAVDRGEKDIVDHLLDHPQIEIRQLADNWRVSALDSSYRPRDIVRLRVPPSQTRGGGSEVAIRPRVSRVFDRASLLTRNLVGR